VWQLLADRTTFNPTTPFRPFRDAAGGAVAGRMTVDQELFHERKLPPMLMEQVVQYNSKLGHRPTARDQPECGFESFPPDRNSH
jgi:hypothetical protein